MTVSRYGLAAVVSVALIPVQPGLSQAQGTSAWLHIRVEEPAKPSKVSVNLPMAVVEVALQAAPERIATGGRLHLGHHHHNDVSVSQLRRAWNELRSAGDTEFVTVEEEDDTVRISRAGNLVLVQVDKAGSREAVRVEVPVDVVDALLSGQGDELNVRAALARLQSRRGDIVRVNDRDSTVRIWIDERKQP
jgi:hypothetical protein